MKPRQLADMLRCPVCAGPLALENGVVCRDCDRHFLRREFGFDLIPYDDLRGPEWEVWKKLQENGLYVYETAPENNLAVGERWDARAFGAFCGMSGAVLDIGCGIQEYPSYIQRDRVDCFIGVDPLAGQKNRAYPFVQALGEFLPFDAATFDHCIFATTLDHFVSAPKGLAEAKRVVKKGGAVHVWHGCSYADAGPAAMLMRKGRFLSETYWRRLQELSSAGEYGSILRKVLEHAGLVQRHAAPSAPRPAAAALEVPDGAEDPFHVRHFSEEDLLKWAREAGFTISREKRIPSSFVSYHLFLTLSVS